MLIKHGKQIDPFGLSRSAADLPVELPTRYELVVNGATAKALKLDIPANLLALVD